MSDDHEPDRLTGLHPGSGIEPDPFGRYRDPRTGAYDPRRLAESIARHPAASAYDRRAGRWVRGQQRAHHDPSPEARPPDPTNLELEAAARERAAYYEYLNGRGPKPELRYQRYWEHVGG